jgi:hypothetical protein
MNNRHSSIDRQFKAMDFLNMARNDPSTLPHTFKSYIISARREGLSTPAIAAGLGRPVSFVEALFADGGV